jgi:membrane protein CcdC involved in cytochrome C biogenesis
MMFSTYKEVDGKYLYLENSLTFNILGVGKDILKITFKKLITFNNVLHVANIGKNSVFDSLLSKISFKMVFEIDKFILSKNDVFIKEKKKKNVFMMALLR